MNSRSGENRSDDGPGGGLVGPTSLVVLLATLVVLVATTFYGIWAFWPSESAKPDRVVHLFGRHSVSRETQFFVIVALSGALGGSVYSLRSIAWYVGNRKLKWSWAPTYILRPIIGATLATLFYFILRAGLFSPSSKTNATSPYGFAATSALVGLFSEQAVEKLKTVAEQFFQEAPKGLDHADTAREREQHAARAGRPPVGSEAAPKAPTARGSAAVTGDASDISDTEATVSGAATSVGSAAFRFEYGTDTAYGSATPDQALSPDTADAPVSAVLAELIPATLYHYRLVVTDETGTSYGDDRTVPTTD